MKEIIDLNTEELLAETRKNVMQLYALAEESSDPVYAALLASACVAALDVLKSKNRRETK